MLKIESQKLNLAKDKGQSLLKVACLFQVKFNFSVVNIFSD